MSGTGSAPSAIVLDALREAAAIPGTLAVQVLGYRSGTIYLNDGRVTGADSSGTPDIRTRLIRSGFANDGDGRAGNGSPEGLREDLRRRISDGSVDVRAVEAIAESVILDAAQNLLYQPGGSAPRLLVCPGRQSAHGIDHRVAVEDLISAVAERAASSERLAADPDLPVTLNRLRRPGVVIDGEQWHIISRASGRMTPRDIAWAAGAELYATLLMVDRLVAAGLCSVPQRAGLPAQPVPGGPSPGVLVGVAGEPAGPGIAPQRRAGTPPGGIASRNLTVPDEFPAGFAEDAPDDPDLIQRLISGLRALG